MPADLAENGTCARGQTKVRNPCLTPLVGGEGASGPAQNVIAWILNNELTTVYVIVLFVSTFIFQRVFHISINVHVCSLLVFSCLSNLLKVILESLVIIIKN